MPRRVLVTGGAGFIGSHMVDRLVTEGYETVVLDNLSTGLLENVNPNAEFVLGDVAVPSDLDSLFQRGIDVVFHIAGQASTIRSFNSPEDDIRTNLCGTVNIVKKCLEYRVPRLMFASSMMVYGEPRVIPTSELESCIPVTYYGITKYAAERYVNATARREDLNCELSVTSFRMFNVYGERQSLTNPYQGVVAIFVGNVLRGEPITIYGDGEQSRDFVHISDVVEAWFLALDSSSAVGKIFNVGSGMSSSVNVVADVVLSALSRSRVDFPVIYAPPRPNDVRQSTANVDQAAKCLGWKPRISFGEGMAPTVQWAIRQASVELQTGKSLR